MEQIPVFVISLKHSTERRERMSSLLKKIGIKFEFIDAIDGKELSEDQVKSIQGKCHTVLELRGFPMTSCEIGCAMSHWKTYEKMSRENIEMACILEDDIEVTAKFLSCLDRRMIERIHPDWGIFMLGHWLPRRKPEKGVLTKWRNRRTIDGKLKSAEPLQPNYGAYGYVINKTATKILLQIPEPFTIHIDNITGAAELYGVKRYLAVSPVVFPCLSLKSTITDREVMQAKMDRANADVHKEGRPKTRIRRMAKKTFPSLYRALHLAKNRVLQAKKSVFLRAIFLRLGIMGEKERSFREFKL